MPISREQFIPNPVVAERSQRKDQLHRLQRFADWVEATGHSLENPNLAIYQRFLEVECNLASSSIQAHLSTVRGRYKELSGNTNVLQRLILQNISNASCDIPIHLPNMEEAASTKDDYLRLELSHLRTLLEQPDTSTLVGLRDRAIIAMIALMGLRGREVCALEMEDLTWGMGDRLFLYVPNGVGCKERYVPYGDYEALLWTQAWLEAAQVTEGEVFRGLYKNERVHPKGLAIRTLELILTHYPIEVDGKTVAIKSLDLRRFYAARLYNIGVPLGNIQAHLGIQDLNAVAHYVGAMDTPQQPTPTAYLYDLPPADPRKEGR